MSSASGSYGRLAGRQMKYKWILKSLKFPTGLIFTMFNCYYSANVDHLVTTHQGVDPACSSCLQQFLIEKVDW